MKKFSPRKELIKIFKRYQGKLTETVKSRLEEVKPFLKDTLFVNLMEGTLLVAKVEKDANKTAAPLGSLGSTRLLDVYTLDKADFELAAEYVIDKLENSAMIKRMNFFASMNFLKLVNYLTDDETISSDELQMAFSTFNSVSNELK